MEKRKHEHLNLRNRRIMIGFFIDFGTMSHKKERNTDEKEKTGRNGLRHKKQEKRAIKKKHNLFGFSRMVNFSKRTVKTLEKG